MEIDFLSLAKNNYHYARQYSDKEAIIYLFSIFEQSLEGVLSQDFELLFFIYNHKRKKQDFLTWLVDNDIWRPYFPGDVLQIIDLAKSLISESSLVAIPVMPDNQWWHEWYRKYTAKQRVLARPFINKTLQKFVWSASALNSIMSNQFDFYHRYILKIAVPSNPAMIYGSAVHNALEQLYRKMQQSSVHEFPNVDVFIADFEKHISKYKHAITRQQFIEYLERGYEKLKKYYQQKINNQTNKVASIEKYITNISVENIPIKGFIDKILFEGKVCTIVDYKTGKAPNGKQQLPHNYQRQLAFYVLLLNTFAQHQNNGWRPMTYQLEYVEADEDNVITTFSFNNTDLHIQQTIDELKWAIEEVSKEGFLK